ncbi:MAG: hypothetical protein K5695_01345, partial [Oscillospiraceae bacterium]|nr:hypothetical protein [Oscillospiraceae bacterium]
MKKPIIRRILSGVSAFAMTASFMFPSGFTLKTMAASSYNVELNLYDHDGTSPSQIYYDGNAYYILVRLMEQKGTEEVPVGWSLTKADLSKSSAPYVFDKFYTYENDGKLAEGAEPVPFSTWSDSTTAPNYYIARAGLYVDPYGRELDEYADLLKPDGEPQKEDGISRDVPGYAFMASTKNASLSANDDFSATLNIFKTIPTYSIELTVDDGVSTDDLYLVTQVKHSSGDTKNYNVQKVTGTKTYDLQTVDGQQTTWYNRDGGTVDEYLTGNEVYTPYLYRATAGETEADIAKAVAASRSMTAADGYKVAKVTDNKTDSNTENGITTVISKFAISETELSNDVNFKNVLGNAVNFGIVADRFHKQDHAETNAAVNYYHNNCGSDISPDLSGEGNFAGDFYISNFINFGFTGEVTDPATQPVVKDKTIYKYGPLFDDDGNPLGDGFDPPVSGNDGKIFISTSTSDLTLHTDTAERLAAARDFIKFAYISPDDCTNNVINPMIAYFSEKSNTLKEHPANAFPVDMGDTGYFLNVQDYPADAVIYVDADKIADALAGRAKLTVNMRRGQTIVWNFDETKEVKISQFDVNFYNADGSLDEYSPVDTSAKTGEPGRTGCEWLTRSFIWNLNSVDRAWLERTAGVFLNPDPDSIIESTQTSSGWIATAGYYSNTGGEWHFMYSEAEELQSSISYTIELNKYDDSRNDLAGAQIGLYPVDANGNVAEAPKATLPQGTTGNNPDNMRVTPGRYAIKEISAPLGYIKTDTTYYIEVTEDEKTGEVTIKAYKDKNFNEVQSEATYSPNALFENTYDDGQGNKYTFKYVDENTDPEVYKNGTLVDAAEAAKFTFTKDDTHTSTQVYFDGTPITPVNGGYPIGDTSFELKFNKDGDKVDEATAIDPGKTFRLEVTYGAFWTTTTTLYHGEDKGVLNTRNTPNGSMEGTTTLNGYGNVKVNYTDQTINSLKLEGRDTLDKFTIQKVPNYTVSYNGQQLYAPINLSEKLSTQFNFTNAVGATVKKVQEDGETQLKGATIALIQERYTLDNGVLTLSDTTPIPEDGSDASARNIAGWSWDPENASFSFKREILRGAQIRSNATQYTVFRLIETSVPDSTYQTPEKDIIIAKKYKNENNMWDLTSEYYITEVAHRQPLETPLFKDGAVDTANWKLMDWNTDEGRTIKLINVKKAVPVVINKQAINSTIPETEDQTVSLGSGNNASFTLTADTTVDENLTLEGVVINNGTDALPAGTTSTKFEGASTTFTGLKPGTYELEETTAPNGFTVVSKFKFTVSASGAVALVDTETTGATVMGLDSNQLVVTDDISQIEINKTFVGVDDPKTMTEGAELKLTFKKAEANRLVQLIDNADTLEEGKSVTWNTKDANPKKLIGLMDGTYELTEESTPSGYVPANAEEIIIKNGVILTADGTESTSFTLKNEKENVKSFSINKKIITDNGAEEPKDDRVEYKLYVKEGEMGDLTGVVINSGEPIAPSASGEPVTSTTITGNVNEIIGLPTGTYVLKETVAPDGYTLVNEFTFTVEDGMITNYESRPQGDVVVENGNIIVKDDISTIQVSKRDLEGEEIKSGEATYTLKSVATDEQAAKPLNGVTFGGKPVEGTDDVFSADFTGNDVTIIGLKDGTYELTETAAPTGYDKVTSTFTFKVVNGIITKSTAVTDGETEVIAADATGTKIVVKDAPTKEVKTIKINKTDLGGNEITTGDVTYTITAETEGAFVGVEINGELIDKEAKNYTFTGNKTEIKGLKDGKYELKEQLAPDGYTVVETAFKFEVKDGVIIDSTAVTSGDVEVIASSTDGTEINVKDDISTIQVSKRDLEGEEIKSGEATYTLKSVATGEQAAKPLNGVTFGGKPVEGTDDKFDAEFTGNDVTIIGLKDGTYELTETAAPTGYDKVTSTFTFVVENGVIKSSTAVTDGEVDVIAADATG